MAQYPLESLPAPVAPASSVLLVFHDPGNDSAGSGESVSGWAGGEFPEAQILNVADARAAADGVAEALSVGDAYRIVLVSGSLHKDDSALQAALARSGVDPLSLVVVDLMSVDGAPGHDDHSTREHTLLRGAVARARAYQGAAAANMKIEFVRRGGALGRRDLFAMPGHRYVAVPAVLPEECGAGRGCTVCADACPFDAIDIRGRKVIINKDECTRCAVCLPACPTEAMYLPDCTPARVEAEIDATLPAGETDVPRSVVFMCERGLRQLRTLPAAGGIVPPEWVPVEVPCLAAVRPAWIYHALGQGADRVLLASCFEKCAVGQSATAAGTVDGCREILSVIGADPDLVRYEQPAGRDDLATILAKRPTADRLTAKTVGAPGTLSPPGAEYEALNRLVQAANYTDSIMVRHPATRTGRVTIDDSSCTGCLTCVDVCPPRALQKSSGNGRLQIDFDAAACTACGLCERRCPEREVGAITVERAILVGAYPVREVVFRDSEAVCEVCGRPIAPNAMLQKVEDVLRQDGGDFDAIVDRIRRRCTSCRGLS